MYLCSQLISFFHVITVKTGRVPNPVIKYLGPCILHKAFIYLLVCITFEVQ